MPERGKILDLGSGWGMLSFALCLGARERQVTGVDHDSNRIRFAARAVHRLREKACLVFEHGDVTTYLATLAPDSVSGIAMIDLLHYFEPVTQQALVAGAARALTNNGVLLVRDIDADDGMRAVANKLYERLATGIGYTKSAGARLFFRGAKSWTGLLEGEGFRVESRHSGPPFLADVLFVARKIL